MTPNWGKFNKIVNQMVTETLGAESLTIETPAEITYDFDLGEIENEPTREIIKATLIPTNKDDLKDLPEGYRERVTRKIYTIKPIAKNAKVISNFDGNQYEVIIPSAALTSGGMVHCHRTFLGRIENAQLAEIPNVDGDDNE